MKKEKLEDLLMDCLDDSSFHMYRNMVFAAGGVQLIIVLLLAQIWKESSVLDYTLYSSVVGIPLWIGIGSIYEIYILLGEESYEHFRKPIIKSIVSASIGVASISLFLSLSFIIYYLNSFALWFFAASIFLTMMVVIFLHTSIEKFLKNNNCGK